MLSVLNSCSVIHSTVNINEKTEPTRQPSYVGQTENCFRQMAVIQTGLVESYCWK